MLHEPTRRPMPPLREVAGRRRPLPRGVALSLSLLVLLLAAHLVPAGAGVAKGAKPGAAAYADAEDDDEEVAPPPPPPPPPPGPPRGEAESPPLKRARRGSRQQVASSVQDEDLDNLDKYDEDEFEGLETLKEKRGEESRSRKAAAEQQRRQHQQRMMQHMAARRKEPIEYWPEGLALFVVLVYAINYIVGSSKNRAMAEAWLEACMHKLEDNFALVGMDGRGSLVRESASQYKLYCSGRVMCVCARACEHISVHTRVHMRQRADVRAPGIWLACCCMHACRCMHPCARACLFVSVVHVVHVVCCVLCVRVWVCAAGELRKRDLHDRLEAQVDATIPRGMRARAYPCVRTDTCTDTCAHTSAHSRRFCACVLYHIHIVS